jgi:hypothetical protein
MGDKLFLVAFAEAGPPSIAGHQRTADTPAGGGRADGRTPRRAADSGQGGAILRMGIHAYAMGEGRIRREPQHGGREDVSTTTTITCLCCCALSAYCTVLYCTPPSGIIIYIMRT